MNTERNQLASLHFYAGYGLEQAFTKKEKKAIKLITQKLKTIGLHSQFNGRKTGHFL